jgi:hypothetical protein
MRNDSAPPEPDDHVTGSSPAQPGGGLSDIQRRTLRAVLDEDVGDLHVALRPDGRVVLLVPDYVDGARAVADRLGLALHPSGADGPVRVSVDEPLSPDARVLVIALVEDDRDGPAGP